MRPWRRALVGAAGSRWSRGASARRSLRGPTAALLLLALLVAACAREADPELAIVGATIHPAPGAEAIRDGVVLARGSRIAAVGRRGEVEVPADARVLDATGLTLTAGFWNGHVHFTSWRLMAGGFLPGFVAEGAMEDMLTRFGFVHVLDTGSWLGSTRRLREWTEADPSAGPEIRIAGGSLVPPGGSPFYLEPLELPEVASPEEARKRVAEALDAGADGIKIFTGGLASPERVVHMEPEIVRAASEAAQTRGAFVVAHPSDSTGARAAIEGGVDILAHSFPREGETGWDRSLLRRMKERGMALVPTLELWEYELERAGFAPERIDEWIRTAQAQVRAYAALDGEILFGTDVGYMTDYDPSDEYAYLAEAGLSFDRILASLTTAPAERFGVAGTSGRVAEGFEADLVLLEGDPVADPRALARVRYAIREGEVVYRKP